MKQKLINDLLIERLKEMKEEKGAPLDEIEAQIGISKGSLSKYINGIHLPNSEVIRKLASYWGVSSDYLLGVSDERNPKLVNADREISQGYLDLIHDAMKSGISESELKGLIEMAKKLKGNG